MKITVFGASGRTGRLLVEQALAAGHDVTAFVRDQAKLSLRHERLRVVRGDVRDAAMVDEAVRGRDAVISTLGPTRHGPKDVMAVGLQNIVAAMEKHGVRRLIVMTGAGVPAPEDRPQWWNRAMSLALKLISPDVLADSLRGIEAVRRSGLDWTVVRVPRLTSGPRTGQVRVGWVGIGTGGRIVRPDAADFLLQQVTDKSYLRQAPMISN